MDIPADWLSETQLAAALAIPADGRSAFHNNLRNWRRRWLLPRRQGLLPVPASRNLGIGIGNKAVFGAGNEAVYPPVTLPMLRLIFKLREEGRKPDEWLWQLWLAEYPADIVGWSEYTLRRIEAKAKEELASRSENEALHEVTRKPRKRTDPRRQLYRHSYRGGWYALMAYPLAALLRSRSPDALFASFASALSAFTGPADMSPARIVEAFSFDEFIHILNDASEAELALAREDCQTIARATEELNMGAAFLFGGMWRDLRARSFILPTMIGMRRLFNNTQSFAEMLSREASGEPPASPVSSSITQLERELI